VSTDRPDPKVSADIYDDQYFLQSCGGIEFFKRYGPKILKPMMQLCWKRARVEKGMRVADVGCGRGEILYQLVASGAEAHGLDYSPSSVAIARSHSPSADIRVAETERLPYSDGSLDLVFFLGVFEHLYPKQQRAAFHEFWRVLKPGGRVILATCTNRLYHKNLTFALRLRAAGLLRRLGLDAPDPSRPRSDEDLSMHVDEQSFFSLTQFFREKDWIVRIEAVPNVKYLVDELYGPDVPADLPLGAVRGWRRELFLKLLFVPPLRWYLARAHVVIAVKPG
jgi:SAM-dependent methyltransferase